MKDLATPVVVIVVCATTHAVLAADRADEVPRKAEASAAAGQAQVLTLEQCLQAAIQNNRQRPSSQFAVAMAEAPHRQALAGSGLVENVSLSEMVEDALRILEAGLVRHKIKVVRDFEPLPTIAAEKHKMLQILLNLSRNAKQAVKERDGGERLIRVCIRRLGESRISLAIQDTGAGLPPENLTRIFGHGFTTKVDGHGFGLHSCALAASQMGGSLRAESDGPGRGATFILDLPPKTAHRVEARVS
jgi:C4-dicarboxylate-specific signal transduction histidine kinase